MIRWRAVTHLIRSVEKNINFCLTTTKFQSSDRSSYFYQQNINSSNQWDLIQQPKNSQIPQKLIPAISKTIMRQTKDSQTELNLVEWQSTITNSILPEPQFWIIAFINEYNNVNFKIPQNHWGKNDRIGAKTTYVALHQHSSSALPHVKRITKYPIFNQIHV